MKPGSKSGGTTILMRDPSSFNPALKFRRSTHRCSVKYRQRCLNISRLTAGPKLRRSRAMRSPGVGSRNCGDHLVFQRNSIVGTQEVSTKDVNTAHQPGHDVQTSSVRSERMAKTELPREDHSPLERKEVRQWSAAGRRLKQILRTQDLTISQPKASPSQIANVKRRS